VPPIFKRPSALLLGAAAVAVLFIMPAGLRADEKDAPTLSDSVGDGLAKLEPLLTAKDWNGAMVLVEGLLQTAAPDSYDAAILNRTEAQILTQKGDYTGVVAPLERALEISDRHHFFTGKEQSDILYFLSQLYYQLADQQKGDRASEVADLAKAIGYIERWFTVAPKPTEDNSLYYAQLLYADAVAKDPAHPDAELIKRSREQVEKTLLMSVHPKDGLYIFLLATLQQEQNYARATEVLELLLAHNPNSRSYWMDLDMFYMALAQDPKDKDDRKVRMYNIRAINTIERAQALGFMNTPRDNYTLFTLYYNIGQYGIAADLLHAGLKAGTIDSDLQNWLLLAASYQQINQDFTAIEVLKEAAQRYPKNGELEFKIAQVYQQLDNNQAAFDHVEVAVEKGGLAKPQQTYMFIAYMAYELSKFDEAKMAIDKAIELLAPKPADHQALALQAAIEEAIKERDAKKAPPAADNAAPATANTPAPAAADTPADKSQ
jgi:tetratricopeptide (TPR) repeat protein